MLIFLDTEYTDTTLKDLISIGMVSEDGQHELYLEVQDFDRTKCSPFVIRQVLPLLGTMATAITPRTNLQGRLREWFATLPRSIAIACDSPIDRQLLSDVFENAWPENITGWFDLRPLIDTSAFHGAVEKYHTMERPWHHALYDAQAHRIGWLAWMDEKAASGN